MKVKNLNSFDYKVSRGKNVICKWGMNSYPQRRNVTLIQSPFDIIIRIMLAFPMRGELIPPLTYDVSSL